MKYLLDSPAGVMIILIVAVLIYNLTELAVKTPGACTAPHVEALRP